MIQIFRRAAKRLLGLMITLSSKRSGTSLKIRNLTQFKPILIPLIAPSIFRLDSSILGQRKKNQKRRDCKLRAQQRRVSEGDSADYDEMDHNGGDGNGHKVNLWNFWLIELVPNRLLDSNIDYIVIVLNSIVFLNPDNFYNF